MYYSVCLSGGYQNGIKIYSDYSTSSMQVNAPVLAGALILLSTAIIQDTLLGLSSVALTVTLVIGFYKILRRIRFNLDNANPLPHLKSFFRNH